MAESSTDTRLAGRALLAAVLMMGTASTAGAEQLLAGTVDGTTPFVLSGESREQVVGGRIAVGERIFTITRQSRLGLLGASRVVHEAQDALVKYGEYAVFSSSFSTQTAVGNPWPVASDYQGCDVAYNSFLAIYHVAGEDRVAALGETPYGPLAEDLGASDQAVVYCFMSRPPAAQ